MHSDTVMTLITLLISVGENEGLDMNNSSYSFLLLFNTVELIFCMY